jgi:hypothetical protein
MACGDVGARGGTLFLNYALAVVVLDLLGHAVALFGH